MSLPSLPEPSRPLLLSDLYVISKGDVVALVELIQELSSSASNDRGREEPWYVWDKGDLEALATSLNTLTSLQSLEKALGSLEDVEPGNFHPHQKVRPER